MISKIAKWKILSNNKLILLAIFCIALFVRFNALGENPAGFFRDEASTGYDAYSIMQTGRDQYGKFLPLFCRSFGDYNESLYRFLVVPSVFFFGLTEFAVRFPAAVIGVLTVLIFYFLSRLLFEKKIALIQTFLLAVSPWHILFSRIGFRAILFPFFFCLGLFLFFKGLKKGKFLVLSAAAFSFSLYTYSSARVFVPLFLIILSLFFFKDLIKIRLHSIIACIILVLVLVVLGLHWVSPFGMARASATIQTGLVQYVKNYLSYFSPDFLFFNGDPNLRHSIQGIGQLYSLEIFTVTAGLIALFVSLFKTKNKHLMVLLVGILLYPIPAALTEPNHALRAIIGCVFFSIVSGYGIHWAAGFLKKKSLRIFVTTGILLTIFAGFLNFGKKYFYEYPYYSWYHWDFGWKQAIALSKRKNYRNIFVSNYYFLPHCFILFYSKYPPEKYQKAPIQSLTQNNLKISHFSMPPYHIVSLEDLDPSGYEGSLIITFPRQKEYIRTRMPLKEVGTVKTPDGKVLKILLEITK